MIELNTDKTDVPPSATILISGPPRSGTSMVAAALHAGGLFLGDNLDPACFEDMPQSRLFKKRLPLLQRPGLALRYRRHIALAREGFDLDTITRMVAARNEVRPLWGLKRPNLAPFLLRRGAALFRQPRLVIISRDPTAIAQRMALAEGFSIRIGLQRAQQDLMDNLTAARTSNCPTLLIGYEKARADFDAFLDGLYGFCGLSVPRADYPRIKAFMAEAGTTYLRVAAKPIIGAIDRYAGGVLRGWCRTPGQDGPAEIEIQADDVMVARAMADILRPDLRRHGFGDGRHGFAVDLRTARISDTAIIRAFVTSTRQEIHQSGRRLGEFRPAGRAPGTANVGAPAS